MHHSLVSPVYNEEHGITEFVDRSVAVLSQLGDDFEIILVNDCSTDSTPVLLQKLCGRYPQVKVLNLPHNCGQQAATLLGLRQAKGDFVFLMDSDLQIDPEEMSRLFDAGRADDAWDVITGSRRSRSPGLIRSAASRCVTRIVNFISGTALSDPASTFLLIKQDVLQRACKKDILAQNFTMLLGFMKLRIREVMVNLHPNLHRKSSYTMFQLLEVLLLAVLRYSSGRKTLISMLLVGCLALSMGLLGTVFLIAEGMIKQSALPTNLLVFTTALAVAGMQFIVFGIIIYKLEILYRNMGFRQNLANLHDD